MPLGLGAAAAGVGAVLVMTGGSGPLHSIGRRSLGEIDAANGRIERSIPLQGLPGSVAVAAGRVWVGDGTGRQLRAFSLDGHPTNTVRLPVFPYRLAAGAGEVWASNGYTGKVVEIDARTRRTRLFSPEPRSEGRVQLVMANDSLWAASQDGVLAAVDPGSLRLRRAIPKVGAPEALASGAGALWLAEGTSDTILRIDPRRGRVVRTIPIGGIGEGIAVGENAVWAATPFEGRLWRIDPRSNAVTASIPVGSQPSTVAVTPTAVWVGSATAGVTRLDPRTGRVVQTVRTAGPVVDLDAAGGHVWVSVR